MSKILIIEDDETLSKELAFFLKKNGYETVVLNRFDDTLNYMLASDANLILLDLGLPYIDGQSLLRMFRKESKVPVIIVTSKDTEMDELLCMSMGADDFISKPYNTTLLLLHIEAILRRCSGVMEQDKIRIHNLTLNISKYTVSNGEMEIDFSKNEFGILLFLVKNKGKITSREDIIGSLWDSCEFVDDNTLTVNMTRVRHKLEELGQENLITTKRGQGYIIEA